MVSHSPATARGLKILVSGGIRFHTANNRPLLIRAGFPVMALEPSLHPMERQCSMFPLSFARRQVSRQSTPRMKTRIEKGGSRYFPFCPLMAARIAKTVVDIDLV